MSGSPDSRIELWPGAALIVIPRIHTALHAHHAIQLALSWDSELEMESAKGREAIRCRGAWMLPDTAHAVHSDSSVVQLYLAPESTVGRRLQATFAGRAEPIVLEDGIAEHIIGNLSVAFEHGSHLDPLAPEEPQEKDALGLRPAVLSAFENLIGANDVSEEAGSEIRIAPLDARVRKAIRLLSSRAGRELPIRELAQSVGLSDRRLSHLFSSQIGLPIRRYVLWLRVVEAIEALSRGESQSEAAWVAGFADAAHMSRSFQRLFAAPPGAFLHDYVSPSKEGAE